MNDFEYLKEIMEDVEYMIVEIQSSLDLIIERLKEKIENGTINN